MTKQNHKIKTFLKNFGKFLTLLTLFFSFFSLQAQAQVQNPINLGIVAVTKDGQKLSTTKVNNNKYTFDQDLGLNDLIRFQYNEGVFLSLSYVENPTFGGGYIKIYKDSVSDENFLLNVGGENYPVKISELAPKLNSDKNELLFVYVNSTSNVRYTPVNFEFNYVGEVTKPELKVVSPGGGSVFDSQSQPEINLEINNFELSANPTSGVQGRMEIYFDEEKPENLLFTQNSSENLGENRYLAKIPGDQINFNQVPDGDRELIFVLKDSTDQVVATANQNVTFNFNQTIEIEDPEVSIIEPKKESSNLLVNEETKFVLKIQNFTVLQDEVVNEDKPVKENEGYLQIFVDEGFTSMPVQTRWTKNEFTLKEIGYINSESDFQAGNRKVRVQLVKSNNEIIATDEVEIFYEPEVIDAQDSQNVIENSTWRLVIIALTVVLIIGAIAILITKG